MTRFQLIFECPGTPLEEIEQQAINICENLNIERDPVCEGMATTFGPWLYFLATEKMGPELTGDLFCGNFLEKEECYSDETHDLISNWSVDLGPTLKPPFFPPMEPGPGSPKAKVFYFTDVHLDLTYLVTYTYDSSKVLNPVMQDYLGWIKC